MAKRDSGGKQKTTTATAAATPTASSTTGDAMEQLVLAFAEQLGRIAGTVQAKAEGWMDRDALRQQVAGVRDSAAELLDQLAKGVTSMTSTAKKAANTAAAASKAASKGRSGGVVDAPGKKHRKPMPVDPRTVAADAKRANMRSSQTSMKTMKTRGRG